MNFKTVNTGRVSAWRSRLAAVAAIGISVAAAACSGGSPTILSPSGAAPASLAAGPPAQDFTVTISPPSVTVGAATLTVVITNTNVDSSQQLGSVRIQVPSGLPVTSVNFVSGTDTWSRKAAETGQTVTVGGTGSNKLDNGQSVTMEIHVLTTTCGSNTFTNPQGSNEAIGDTFASQWNYTGSTLSVSVTGCPTECPAAPSVSTHYFTAPTSEGGLGLPANDPRHNLVQVAVAQEQGPGATFHGFAPCDAGFVPEVKAFVNAFLASLP